MLTLIYVNCGIRISNTNCNKGIHIAVSIKKVKIWTLLSRMFITMIISEYSTQSTQLVRPDVISIKCHSMMTSSKRNIFRVAGPLCGEFTDHRWIPSQRPVTRSFDVFFHLRLNTRLSEQSIRQWFETPSRLLWRHYTDKKADNNEKYECYSKSDKRAKAIDSILKTHAPLKCKNG